MQVALYARSSSDDPGAIEAELASLRNHAKDNGFTVTREYTDQATSGELIDRPGFVALCREALELSDNHSADRPFGVVLVRSWDRFGRGAAQAIAMAAVIQHRTGIDIRCLNETASERMQLQMLTGAVAVVRQADEWLDHLK